MKVQVYRNLHNGLLSIRERGGVVVGHAQRVVLSRPCFSVMEGGRKRVIREQRKNVHAFMLGELTIAVGFKPYKGRGLPDEVFVSDHPDFVADLTGPDILRVTYNPYKYDTFVDADTEQPIIHAGRLAMGWADADHGIRVMPE